MKEKVLSFSRRLKAAVKIYIDNIRSFLKRSIKTKENQKIFLRIYCALRAFSFREKIVFLFLIALFAGAGLGILWEIDRSLAIEIPKSGGALKEGVIGNPRFINPLLSLSDADRDLTSLIYSGLMRTDGKGELIPDLAEKYEISGDGLSYSFTLKEGLIWPDKKPLTSDDIVFTINLAKNPILKSNQRASWEGVEIEKTDDKTVKFFLKRPYAPFMENTTLGILPKHIWEEIAPEQMTLTDFNIKPIGSGPYGIKNIIKDSTGIIQSYILEPNKKFALGKPYIENLTLKFYPSEKNLISAYETGEIDGAGGISPQSAIQMKRKTAELKTLFLPRVFGVFFNQSNAPILANKEMRQALELAVDKEKIVNEVLQNFGAVLNYPLPAGTIGSMESQEKNSLISHEERLADAVSLLEKNKWTFNEEEKIFEKKVKNKQPLKIEFSLATSNSPELVQTAELLKTMWQALGAKVNVKIFEIGDLNQNVIRPRKYDALLFGMILGRDPDPFAFWHSSQRNDPGLNIALYANISADKLLEEARTISDGKKREEKYAEFQKQIGKDVPAVFLYSPKYIYLVPKSLKGFDIDTITIPPERFSEIYKWHMETEKIWR